MNHPGILVSGCGRDGTTLLYRLLNAHVNISICYEPLSFNWAQSPNISLYNGVKQPVINYPDFQKWRFGRYLFMGRSIPDVVYSLCTRLGKNPQEYYPLVRDTYAAINEFVKSRDNAMRVSYTDLCQNPRDTMGYICEFLGIRFDPNVLKTWGTISLPNWVIRNRQSTIKGQYKTDRILSHDGQYKCDLKFCEKYSNIAKKGQDTAKTII